MGKEHSVESTEICSCFFWRKCFASNVLREKLLKGPFPELFFNVSEFLDFAHSDVKMGKINGALFFIPAAFFLNLSLFKKASCFLHEKNIPHFLEIHLVSR